MTIEEKAKAYDNLIERLKDFQFEYRFSPFSDVISDKFPELVESEDERIGKELTDFVKSRLAGFPQCEKFIAWIEKAKESNTNTHLPSFDEAQGTPIINQGEQKPWSEEDESRITTICTYLQDYARLSGCESRTIRINEYCDWLKSLKERYTWKPSDEYIGMQNEIARLRAKLRDYGCEL